MKSTFTHLLKYYNAHLADRLSLDMEKLEKLSESFLDTYEPPVTASAASSTPSSSASAAPAASGVCTYLLKSGKNRGQPCGAKEKVGGSCRCKTHEGKEEPEKKEETPAVKAASGKTTQVDKPATSNKSATSSKTVAKSAVKPVATKPSDEEEPVASDSNEETSQSESEESDVEEVKISSKSSAKPKAFGVPKSSKARKAAEEKMEGQKVMNHIHSRRNDIHISKNQFGNYVHTGTSLVWDRDTVTVSGRQLNSGQVIPLNENDIQLCIANGWKYKQEYTISKQQPSKIDDSQLYEEDVSESEDDN